MERLEDVLPPDRNFNDVLQEMRELIVDELSAVVEEQGDIIHVETELSRDVVLLWKLSSEIAALLRSPDELRGGVEEAVYRGICFALQVVDDIKSAPIHHLSMELFTAAQPREEVSDAIHQSTSEYLAHRSHVDSLIGSFATEIDPTYDYHHHVETAAALLFMLCERQYAADYIAAMAEGASSEDIGPT